MRAMILCGSVVLMVLGTGCAQRGGPQISYADSSALVLAGARARTWQTACRQHEGDAHCGMLVRADWRDELNRTCGNADAQTDCVASWFASTTERLEARYGSSRDRALATCGSDCLNPFFLELELMRTHNQRVAAETREELRQALGKTLRTSHDDAVHRQRLEAIELSMASPRTCSSSADCPFALECRRDAGNVNRGYCAAF